MSKLEYQKFDKLFKYLPKSKIKAGDGKKSGKYRFFKSGADQSKFIDTASYQGESLIIGDGGTANINHFDGEFSTSDHCYVIQKNNNDIDTKYVYYFLKSNLYILEAGFKGAGLKNISKKYISSIKIPVLPLVEQQKIASLLTRIETLIQKREESIKLLDELIKSTFLEMFGDPVLNPKGWEMEILDSFGDIITGNTPPRAEEENYNENHIEWIKTDNFIEGRVYPTLAKEYLSEIGLSKGRSVLSGAIMVTCIAGSVKSIGSLSLVNRHIAFNQQINAIQPYESINSIFLYYMLKNSKKYIQDQAGKGMKKIITKSVFKNISFFLPPKFLQDKFASIVTKIEATKEKYQASLNELNNFFNATAQKAFKGELKLDNLEIVENNIIKEETPVLDKNKVLELIQSGHFELKKYVNEKQSYDDIRDMVLKLLDEERITQIFTKDKKIILKAIT